MKRVLWFSPRPPARTDIANFSARVLPHLSRLATVEDIDLGADRFVPEEQGLRSRWLNSADVAVYHIGNNVMFHGAILASALSHPGIVVLHDRAIHELVLGVSRQTNGTSAAGGSYLEAMSEWYGQPGLSAARAVLGGRVQAAHVAQQYPLFEVAVSRALGVVCHNSAFADEVRRRFPGLPVLDLPLPYPRPALQAGRSPRPPDQRRFRLAAFGFLGLNRRIVPIIQAWGTMPRKHLYELHLAGEIDDIDAILALARDHGLADHVHWHGFLPEQSLDALIADSDLVLNLRLPTMGEASGSQLRIWANHVASAVTDVGWYAQLPDDCVCKVSPDNEADDIKEILAGLAEGRIDVTALGRNGYAALAAHDPGLYARNLVAWIEEESGRMSASWSNRALSNAVASAVARCTPASVRTAVPPSLISSR